MALGVAKKALVEAGRDITKNHVMPMAAGLSYYFVLSIFPLLIFLAAAVTYLPVPNLFDQILTLMARVVPPDSMGLVRSILAQVISPHRAGIMSFGALMTLWSASGGFSSMIEALNVAYDVPETRPFWKTKLLALELTFVIGGLTVFALALMIVGPQFGEWLANHVGLAPVFAAIWPYVRWGLTIGFTVLAVEVLYFLAPNVRQKFWATLPGAILAVGTWIGLSHLLGIYFRNYADYNKTYGTLGAAIAFIVWLYWSALAILAGAELNSEIIQLSGDGRLPLKKPPPTFVVPKHAADRETIEQERAA